MGGTVATDILAARAHDGSDAVGAPPGGSGPGVWIPTPPAFLPYLLPQWGFVVPFGMMSSSQFRPPGPPSLTASNTRRITRRSRNSVGLRFHPHRRPDRDRLVLGGMARQLNAARATGKHSPDDRRRMRQHDRRKREVVRPVKHRHGRRCHLCWHVSKPLISGAQ